MIGYCDSSALIKRYLRERGSRWFREQQGQRRLITSALAIAEIASALSRRNRDGTISMFEFHRGRTQFNHHLQLGLYTLLPVALGLIRRAALLVYEHPLSGYDAVHLASALSYAGSLSDSDAVQFQFITADDQLRRAAEAKGLQTENPNAYS